MNKPNGNMIDNLNGTQSYKSDFDYFMEKLSNHLSLPSGLGVPQKYLGIKHIKRKNKIKRIFNL